MCMCMYVCIYVYMYVACIHISTYLKIFPLRGATLFVGLCYIPEDVGT